MRKCKLSILKSFALIAVVIALSFGFAMAQDNAKQDVNVTTLDKVLKARGQVTPSERKAAAQNAARLGLKIAKPPVSTSVSTTPATPEPGTTDPAADQTN
jgi:hypothetical protein